jgi:predicted component of type VI protein secretion system
MSREFLVGRDPSCAFVLSDETVSSRHAELSLTADGRLFVVDRASRNGTFAVSGGARKKVRQVVVRRGDQVVFGECQVPVADLIAAVQVANARDEDAKARQPRQPVTYVRCACGTVKPEGAACPCCGNETRGPRR